MMVKNAFKGFLSSVCAHRKIILVIFEALWLLLIWVLSPFVPDGSVLVIPPIAAAVISLVMVPCVSCTYSCLKKAGLFEPKMAELVLYGTSYLLSIYLAIVLLEKLIQAFHIDKIENVEFALQVIPFLLYIVVFWVFRDPKQLKYWAYALAYGLFVVWEWAENWGIENIFSKILGIDSEFALNFFIIPFKEAMLLFIILDTFLKAKSESKAGKGAA
jgi:hypothetical protein